jgi:YidC/Oxa1 family membrane protein insertase
MYQNQPTEQELAAEKAKKEQLESKKVEDKAKTALASNVATDTVQADSTKMAQLKSVLGNFAYSATLPSAKNSFTTIENDLLSHSLLVESICAFRLLE